MKKKILQMIHMKKISSKRFTLKNISLKKINIKEKLSLKYLKKMSLKKKITAAVAFVLCVVLITGSVMTVRFYAAEDNVNSQVQGGRNMKRGNMQDAVSADGYIETGMKYQLYELMTEGVELEVEEVCAAAADTVEEGANLLKLSLEDIAEAKVILEAAAEDTENAYMEERIAYSLAVIDAKYTLMEASGSDEIALAEFEAKVSQLKSKTTQAKSSMNSAQTIVSDYPDKIEKKQKNKKTAEKKVTSWNASLKKTKKELASMEEDYTSELNDYESTLEEYEAIRSVYAYLLNYLGEDTSKIEKIETVEIPSEIKDASDGNDASSTDNSMPSDSKTPPSNSNMPNMATKTTAAGNTKAKGMILSAVNQSQEIENVPQVKEAEVTTENTESVQTADSINPTDPTNVVQNTEATAVKDNTNPTNVTEGTSKDDTETTVPKIEVKDIASLKSTVEAKYKEVKAAYASVKSSFQKTAKEYQKLQTSINSYEKKISEKEQTITQLTQEIKQLKQELSKAEEQLPSLKTAYQQAVNNQITETISLELDYETSLLASDTAQETYDETIESLDTALAEAEDTMNTAQENLEYFEQNLSDGYVKAEQAGTLTMIGYTVGDVLNVNIPLAIYIDDSTYTITVSVSQEDITSLEVGDSATIMTTDGATCSGTIAAISSSSTSGSVSNVNYEVTVQAEEGAEGLSSGLEATVYFNTDRIMDRRTQNGEMPSMPGGKNPQNGEMPGMSDGEKPQNDGMSQNGDASSQSMNQEEAKE